ncbi:MAG TPA: right-handed parallel beta-helix repeat-containing protein, partial [Phycisphaerae bacterium]|nr:right-handed parallel beta-helix repeat-containing protein [Phycisphaerae bacterium]
MSDFHFVACRAHAFPTRTSRRLPHWRINMFLDRLTRLSCIAISVLAIAVASAGADVVAERLAPDASAPGVVETMDIVLAREAAQPAEAPAHAVNHRGEWAVPSRGATGTAHTGDKYIVNKWGDPSMGIRFPAAVDVMGVFIAGQGGPEVWARGVRAIGYRDGAEVARTDWFEDIGTRFRWMALGLQGIDRLVLEAQPAVRGAGWYKLDDLVYRPAGETPVVLSFEDLPYRAKLTGGAYGGLVWEEGEGEYAAGEALPPPRVPPGYGEDRATAEDPFAGSRLESVPPRLLFDFQGVIRGDAGSFSYPPDTCGAIGPNHFLEIVNRNFAVYDKATGQNLINVTLSNFHPGSSGDPRVLFDPDSRRWVTLITDFDARIFLAVSLTDDPTGAWFKTDFIVSSGSDTGCSPDYPTLGVNNLGIYTSAYMVGCGGMSIFAIDKAPLIAPEPELGTVTAFRGLPFEGAIQPVITYGDPGAEYFVSAPSSGIVRVRRIVGPGDAPTLEGLGNISVAASSEPADVPALGSVVPLDSVGSRLMNAVYRDGSIWTAHTIDSSGRAGCRWYELDPAAMTVIQQGTVSDPVLNYFFPSITVNAVGHAVMGFSGAHSGQYAGAYYTGRRAADPPGTMAPPVQYRAGAAPQNNIDGFGRNRWGDYSLTTLDPADDLTMWTIQEYAHAEDIWGTHIAEISVGDCNLNNVDDEIDIAAGTSRDCNDNLLPDECESTADCQSNGVQDICDIAAGSSLDCTGNGVPDECEPDCNGDGIADSCDIAAGTSLDCNRNGVPDECDLHDCCDDLHGAGCSLSPIEQCVCAVDPYCCAVEWDRLCAQAVEPLACGVCPISLDCNLDTIPDECQEDCNANGVPDDCDIAAGSSADCNDDDVPDECQGGCNQNGVPDACDILAGTSADCDQNGVPDECEGGCNNNGVPDICDVAAGTSADCNANNVPDECEGGCNANGIPDECEIATVHDCCSTQHGPGCNRPEIEACVCAHDAYCCNVNWDRSCTALVEDGTCGACPLVEDCNANAIPDECEVDNGQSAGTCCTTGHGAGCSDPEVEACVCAIDSFCCEFDWDSICVEWVTLFECGSCGGAPSNDCNTNGTPDDCESYADCNGNSVPDECDPDCNRNGHPDDCDLAAGTSLDNDENGTPDECQILRVNVAAEGAQTGLTWADAFTDLQEALAEAAETGVVQEIWIAAGTYVPRAAALESDPRSATFELVAGVDVYGGFAGTEQARDERDPALNRTVLSGEIGAPSLITDNVYNVVTGPALTADTIIDGLTVTAGYAVDIDGWGAGMLFESGNPTVRRCAFVGNRAAWGGGMFVFFGSGPIEDCTFTDNMATEGGGGAYFGASDLTLEGAEFTGNTCAGSFYGGGGLLVESDAPTVSRCRFAGNTASVVGGGMSVFDSNPLIIGTEFRGNRADLLGGGAYFYSTQGRVVNSIFAGNRAMAHNNSAGGGIALYVSSSIVIANSTLVGNRTEYRSGGVYYSPDSTLSMSNCILWDNADLADPPHSFAAQIRESASALTLEYSNVEGYDHRPQPADPLGEGIIDVVPGFLVGRGPDGAYGTDDDNFRLAAGAPCIDAGNSDFDLDPQTGGFQSLPTTDFDGAARFVDDPATPDTGMGERARVDLGPFEYQRDCNSNGVIDSVELAAGSLPDCNANGQADACDISDGLARDCEPDGIPDGCAIQSGMVPDCDASGVPDDCELDAGTAPDCDANDTPDTCDSAALAELIEGPEDQYACLGDAAMLMVEAPAATGFAWYRDGIALVDGGNVTGSATASLTIDPVSAADAGEYHCVIDSGCISAASATSTLQAVATDPGLTLLSAPLVTGCAAPGT